MNRVDIKPLSTNQAWKGRRFKTDKYKVFEKKMMLMLPKIKINKDSKFRININYGFSSKLSDIDNPCKMILDCLVKKYSFDDRQVYELFQKKQIVPKGNDYFEFEIIEIKDKGDVISKNQLNIYDLGA